MAHVILLTLLRLIIVGIWIGAGLSVYLYIFNRMFLLIPVSAFKIPFMNGIGLLLMGLPAVLGWFWPSWTVFLPGLFYAVFLLDELRLIHIRRETRGELPQEVISTNGGTGTDLRPPFSKAYLTAKADTTTDLHMVRYQIDLPVRADESSLSASIWNQPGQGGRSLTVAHLSDLHLNDEIPMTYYTGAFERALAETPDLVLLTGDYVSFKRNLPLLSIALEPLRDHPHVYAILGNHDYRVGAEPIAGVLAQAGVQLLRGGGGKNQSNVEIYGSGISPLVRIFGSEEPWGKACQVTPDPASSLDLILTHTPDNIYHYLGAQTSDLSPGPRVETPRAVFAGHLHAGQLCLPGNPPLSIFMPSRYGRRFDRRPGYDGHFVFTRKDAARGSATGSDVRCRSTHLFVSGGIGAGMPAKRIFCPPDFFVVRFSFCPQGWVSPQFLSAGSLRSLEVQQ